ncbi:hypothetical protein VCHC41B1_0942B, partial [Vibrio cholerae HC-41B1]
LINLLLLSIERNLLFGVN